MAMVLVTHDLGVVAGRTDDIAVMYAGQIVEQAPTTTLFSEVRMPYTEALLRSIPRLENPSHTRLEVIGGRPPDLDRPAAGLPVRAPLPLRAGPLPRRSSRRWSRPTRPATSTAAGTRSAPTPAGRRWSATWPPSCPRPRPRSPASWPWRHRDGGR